MRGADLSAAARAAFAERGGQAFETPQRGRRKERPSLITMLPYGAIVREALLGADGAADALKPGALVIDMSSSAPMDTRRLAEELAAKRDCA